VLHLRNAVLTRQRAGGRIAGHRVIHVRAALAKHESIVEIAARLTSAPWADRASVEFLSTGLSEFDALFGGFPRGAITEIIGDPSSGKTSLLLSSLAAAACQNENCALVDTTNCFDLLSAVEAKIELSKLLWVRCSGNVEHAFKTVDFILHGGGFSLVALDLGDVPISYTNRVVSSWWYRFRHTLENTRTALIVIGQTPCARSAAAQVLELKQDTSVWSVASAHSEKPPPTHAHLLLGSQLCVERRKPLSVSQQRVWLAPRMSYQAD
jgi:RecA DNA recombination protein